MANDIAATAPPLTIGIIAGSTRPGRRAHHVAEWVATAGRRHLEAARPGTGVALEVIDLAEVDLPLLDEPAPAAFGGYRNAHTQAWSATVERLDGFVWVVPEYNHSFPAATKNAIDFLFREWGDKAAGFVSYGAQHGLRAAEQLRGVLAEVKVATVRTSVPLSIFEDFDDTGRVTPSDRHVELLGRLLDEVTAWSGVLRHLRAPTAVPA